MRTLPTRLLIPIAAVAALALLGAGCGGSKKSSSSNATSTPNTSATTTTTPGGGTTVAETATDFKFSQPKPTVKSGAVTIKEVNKGQTPHSIELEGNGIGEKRAGTIGPGQSNTLKVNLKPGKYEFYCPVDGHKQLGMKGELTVR